MSSVIPSPTSAGSLPSGWEIHRLGQISRVYSGGTPSRGNKTYWNGDIPWATTAEVDFGYIRSTKERITQPGLENSAAKVAPPGTLLIAMYGQGKTRGKTAVLDIHAAMNQACAAVEPSAEISTRFLFHFLKASYDNIRGMSNAGGQENLSGEIVKKIPVVVPTRAEQDRISDVLDDSDALIDRLERLIAKKQAIKQGLMQQLLTGKTRLPGFSQPWIETPLGNIASVNMGQSPLGVSYNNSGKGLPLIQGNADIHDRATLDRIWTTSPTKLCSAGDVILTVRAPVGYTAVASKDACLGRGVCSITSNHNQSNRFLFHALVYAERNWFVYEQGSTFTSVNSKEVQSFTLRWPTDEGERLTIADAMDDCDSEIGILQDRLGKTRAIKQGMMQELLTGRTRLQPTEFAV